MSSLCVDTWEYMALCYITHSVIIVCPLEVSGLLGVRCLSWDQLARVTMI